jgi:hypothetical protein
MERFGINEKELRRVEVLVRVKSMQLKVVDEASLLRPLCQVPFIRNWLYMYDA